MAKNRASTRGRNDSSSTGAAVDAEESEAEEEEDVDGLGEDAEALELPSSSICTSLWANVGCVLDSVPSWGPPGDCMSRRGRWASL